MQPDLELVDVRGNESFKVWSHGYPYRTVRWHFHPEYEINLITATTGKFFVGDHIGSFEPGDLFMTGPSLPHNWVSDVPEGMSADERSLVLQFSPDFISNAMLVFPELKCLETLLEQARGGLVFPATVGWAAKPILQELIQAEGIRRVQLFFSLLELLAREKPRQQLASREFVPDPLSYMSSKFNHLLSYIGEHIADDLRESELAEMLNQSVSAFSRSFRKHTGMSFVQYVNLLRINYACELLMNGDLGITDICYKIGFNNVSNFNRRFLEQKGMSPSKFRNLHELHAKKTVAT